MDSKNQVAFYKGTMLRRPPRGWMNSDFLSFVDARAVFTDTLAFESFVDGASARIVVLKSEKTGRSYQMQRDNFAKHIAKLDNGKLFGRFKFKRASAYWSLEFIDDGPLGQLALTLTENAETGE